MADKTYTLQFGDNTAGAMANDHWLQEVASDAAPKRIRVLQADDADTQGHADSALAVEVRVATDEDDTEGHAISLHFPTAEEADAFRRKLIVSGVLVGTLAISAGIGTQLGHLPAGSGVQSGSTTSQTQAWQDASRSTAAQQGAQAASAQANAAWQESSSATGARQDVAAAANAEANQAWQDASTAEGARQGAGAVAGDEAFQRSVAAASDRASTSGAAEAAKQASIAAASDRSDGAKGAAVSESDQARAQAAAQMSEAGVTGSLAGTTSDTEAAKQASIAAASDHDSGSAPKEEPPQTLRGPR